MATSAILTLASEAVPHLELMQAHRETARLAQSLTRDLEPLFQIDLAQTRRKAIAIGNALDRVAKAERACGGCSEEDHTFAGSYREMLHHHRMAYLAFERLSRELGNDNKVPPRCSDIATLAADIEHHLNAAETAHQASIRIQNPEAPTSQQASAPNLKL